MNKLNLLFKRTTKLLFIPTCIILISCLYMGNVQAQSSKITKVTFQKDRYNRIFIPVKVDRDSLSLLFATYSKTLRVTPYFMQTMELQPSWNFLTLTDKNGKKRQRLVFTMPRVDVGNIKFRNEETIVNNAFPDTVITGSTGTLMVYQYNWKIDNDRNEISISKEPFIPTQPLTTINYKNDSFPVVPVEIGGTKDNFVLDFGSGTNFQLGSTTDLGRQLITKYKLKPVNTITSNIHARKMVDTVYEVTVPRLLFNGVELKKQKITLSSAAQQNIVGTGFLGNYNVILNNSRKRKIGNNFILEERHAKSSNL